MNCHQILTGACNAGDHSFAVGSVEGVPFTAYAAGCNIVILASTFERVQIIPGICHNNIRISCVDCSTDTGKIAAAYENQICIFEPTPLIHRDSLHQLDYRWVETGSIRNDCAITSLSWNLEGTRLLTGGDTLQLWHCRPPSLDGSLSAPAENVEFEVGDAEEEKGWECVWKCQTASPAVYLHFSPDGTLFATAGKSDRLVKIWYENKFVLFPSQTNDYTTAFNHSTYNELTYSFIYIAHPHAVTGLSWRSTSKYMPKGSVANMLVTSCRDNICRVWVETVLPDDGLVNMQQFDPQAAQNPKFRTHRHKHRFIQRLKHVKACFQLRRHVKQNAGERSPAWMSTPIPCLPSTFSVHDFHTYGFHGTGITPGLHLHLAASINAETDIPLVPSMAAGDPDRDSNFVLHWLHNKEMYFTLQAERIIQDMSKKVVDKEEGFSQEFHGVHDEMEGEEVLQKKRKTDKRHEENSDNVNAHHNAVSSHHSNSTGTSTSSLNTDAGPVNSMGDSLDYKIELLLKDWHQSPDLLVSIHPVDGSFLVWYVEWLDECQAGAFRQAQVSFSARIPGVLPLGDAMTMSTRLALYNTCHLLDMRNSLHNELGIQLAASDDEQPEENIQDKDQSSDSSSSTAIWPTEPTPVISMISKHTNGTLNLWHITFNEKSRFSHILSIGHSSRASGHRFRVNDITCHPILPLLLTTSHHNVPEVTTPASDVSKIEERSTLSKVKEMIREHGFCSELILWRVDPVGPLSKSGGIRELARVNSPEISAFSNVAWIPTLLPSTTLGNLSNSPSACFVASDGHCLRVYQAVIDARTLLAEMCSAERKNKMKIGDSMISLSSVSSFEDSYKHPGGIHNHIHIVSQQSTARPGCIIQLESIADATHDWQNTQFLHVFQEQLITGEYNKPLPDESINADVFEPEGEHVVDHHQTTVFEEPFYIVLLEKEDTKTVVHTWRLILASQPHAEDVTSMLYVPDIHEDETPQHDASSDQQSHVIITTTKVCTQYLPLPDDVEVIHVSPAGGHLSSASIYPACFAPYVMVTACSDSTVRCWKCEITNRVASDSSLHKYEWREWEMLRKGGTSLIDIPGRPLHVSAAYSGRIACAYKYGHTFTRPTSEDPSARYVNLSVTIYECESTGGSEWIREDTVHLKNIHIPQVRIDSELDLSFLHSPSIKSRTQQSINDLFKSFSHEDVPGAADASSILSVPSISTMQTLRRTITEKDSCSVLQQKHLVQLDWVSTEDGSHILTVGVGNKVLLFTAVSSDIAQANLKAMKESQVTTKRPPMLRKASSLAIQPLQDEIRWMKLRKTELHTADGLPPLPMQMSWVRDGIFVVGMDNEMHIYSQWKMPAGKFYPYGTDPADDMEEIVESRVLRDEDIRHLVSESAQSRLRNVSSVPHFASRTFLASDTKKKKGLTALETDDTLSNKDYMPDFGLFEASRIACPVLPQYHPKQLMEFLNSGKIRWVKAILAHLVRCISGVSSQKSKSSVSYGMSEDEEEEKMKGWSRSRTLSVSYANALPTSPLEQQRASAMMVPEELTLGYAEISSIPPLPLWMLLSADKESAGNMQQNEDDKDYSDLFNPSLQSGDNLDDLLEEGYGSHQKERKSSSSGDRTCLSYFGPRQARVLSRMLTHTHLPGLSSLDQMHLLALADTVATCNVDIAERTAADAVKTAFAKENLTGIPEGDTSSTDTLDVCGLRFLLAMKHYGYLLRCLPISQRAQLQKQGLSSSNLVWAFHSESAEELLNFIPSYAKGNVKWSELKELGVGWWLRSNITLRNCFEKLGKAAYQAKQNPMDAAIFYLAMKKKSVLWGLYRSQGERKMTEFFGNNFSLERWRKAALKNAFALLGKQKFEHAVGFFLLAGALKDAIEVCLNKLEDLQLALVVARLYEGDMDATPPTFKKLLYEEVIGCNSEGKDQDLTKAHPDPFLRSMALWTLQDYNGSLGTLLQTNIGQYHHRFTEEEKPEEKTALPSVFNFYIYLRTHPLLIRQYIASMAHEKKKTKALMLSGFSYGTEPKNNTYLDKQMMFEDSITPVERRLYFTTAHSHFKAGCPMLSLEVLSKLPHRIYETVDGEDIPALLNSPTKAGHSNKWIDTGTITHVPQKADSIDWSRPSAKADELNWSEPVVENNIDEGLELTWEEEEAKEEEEKQRSPYTPTNRKPSEGDGENQQSRIDIMAQQLKFIACLKIMMEELSTLATGFELDGGQLRYQLYVWLEREVEALKLLCNYGTVGPVDTRPDLPLEHETNTMAHIRLNSLSGTNKPTLHELLQAEKLDFEAKVLRAAKRKRWLKANHTLLRTLFSYCSLHGANGGGLASVHMELILLLQELQQDKTQQQLLSPLPFPTTLPLLSASVASNKTVVADPIRHLQSLTTDVLQSLVEHRSPPMPYHQNLVEVFVLRDLAIALAACIYQSLCDSDLFSIKQQQDGVSSGFEGLSQVTVAFPSSSHLIAGQGRRRRYSSGEPVKVSTDPSKWPGVASLRSLLACEKDEDIPRLNNLLCETFVAVFMSLLVFGLTTCDSQILYRLSGQIFNEKSWAALFGGGMKKMLKVSSTAAVGTPPTLQSQNSTEKESTEDQGMWNTVTSSLNKQRMRLNMKILGPFGNQTGQPGVKEDRPAYRERFVSPEMSMITLLMSKPQLSGDSMKLDYDSNASDSENEEDLDEDDDIFDNKSKPKPVVSDQHSNPNSFAWSLMRLTVVKLAKRHLEQFLTVAGLEINELPVSSPHIHAVLHTCDLWIESLRQTMDDIGAAPVGFLPATVIEPSVGSGPSIHKYRCLMETHNTPFQSRQHSAKGSKRLWNYLVRQEPVQEYFIRYIFSKRNSPSTIHSDTASMATEVHDEEEAYNPPTIAASDPVRIIHKEQESISAFCLNRVNGGLMTLATPKEIQELDIALLLNSPMLVEDECEFDILTLNKELDGIPTSNYLVIQTPADRPFLSQIAQGTPGGTKGSPAAGTPTSLPSHGTLGQTGRGTAVITKHKMEGVRRLTSHPSMPFYLSGSQDGSVQMWEWGHPSSVATLRASGTFGKVTRVRFNQQGNKFGITDGDGSLSIWQVKVGAQTTWPFFTHQCHSKQANDFVFLGCSSLVATAGHGSENRNVAIWDTLMPQRKALVTGFVCHEQSCTSILYAPQQQLLLSGGKKGEVCLWDVRQRTLKHRFQAHDSSIRCMALDPSEEFFVTGSADGDVTVWGIASHSVFHSFVGDHARSSFFKNIGQGVTKLEVDTSDRLFSCGADGSMKMRQLGDKEKVVNSIF